MAAVEKHPDLRLQQINPSDPGTSQKSHFLETDWKTPMLSAKFQSRVNRCSSVADSGDAAIGTSCSDRAEDFCNSSNGSSFQPIKTQVTIPTAHVMPSTLSASPSKLRSAGEQSGSQNTSKPVVPGSASGLMRNGDFNAGKSSQVPHGDLLRLCGASGENGFEQSWHPPSDHMRRDDAWKFDTPAIEQTFNQSLFLESLCTDPLHRFQKFNLNSRTTEAGKDQYKVLPESKQAAGANGVCEAHNGAWPNGNRLMPAGLQANGVFSKPTTPPSRAWMQETCTLHPHERVCELSAWKQQLENVRLQIEQMQLQNGAACHHPSVYPAPVPSADPTQWINILNSNENLLKEKELIIDRQRQHISQLEQKVRESELQVHSALLGCPAPPAPYGDVYMLRLQELQRENAFLRAQFTEKTESLGKEKIELERKLAAAEVDAKLIRETVKETVQKHVEELKKQEERVKGRDKHINNLKKKCQKESEQSRERQQRIETLERYLADLPTLEDHQKQSQKLKESELKNIALQETVLALETQLGDIRAAFREQEMHLETQKRKELELLSSVRSLQDKVQQSVKNAERAPPAHDGEKQKAENDSLKKECECLRKIADKQQKKMEQLSLQVKNLEEQVAQEEGTSQALKEEAVRRENALQQLRTAVKELSVQNQDLIEKNLTLQERLRQAELTQPLAGQEAQLVQELHGELATCLQDLQSVFSIVTQRAQGKDPNLSLLLGIRSVQYSAKEKDDLLSPDILAKKLLEVKQLHKEVEDLRTAISDRYAQDMGDNCITQ
ncbi:CEP85 protein, partial [Nothocercus julius]|nr:CEP85 protein [Nothocercus julius]